jgi:hypothetical protein
MDFLKDSLKTHMSLQVLVSTGQMRDAPKVHVVSTIQFLPFQQKLKSLAKELNAQSSLLPLTARRVRDWSQC